MDDSPSSSAVADFQPLRLILQPRGPWVELTEPDQVIGRHSEADIRLPLPDVSRWHCRLLCVEGCWQIIDLNSLNGVYVNGRQVEQAPLHQGDRIRIGGFTFLVDFAARRPQATTEAEAGSLIQNLFQPRRQAS
jgi:pSer/pThr/pTyr-binding forkhead associated (FHA) protein